MNNHRARFRDQVVLVTGGTSGIGLAAAMAYSREGAKVAISARREKVGQQAVDHLRQQGGEAIFVKGDMSDPDSIKTVVSQTVAQFGRLDVAFNCAGRTGAAYAPIYEADEEEFENILAVNTRGVWYATKYEMIEMAKSRGGAIVICGSVASIRGGSGNNSAYYTSKHAIMGLTKQAAIDGAKHGIRVNAVLPGLVMTELAKVKIAIDKERLAGQFANIPMARPGESEEIANAVLFLSSSESSYITGVGLPVDGGFSV